MKKHKFLKVLLILTPVIIGVGVVYYFASRPTGTAPGTGGTGSNPPPGNPPGPATPAGCTFPLQTGSKNDCVKQLQQALGGLTVDGDFGAKTLAQLLLLTGKLSITDANDLKNTIASLNGSGSGNSGDVIFERKSTSNTLQLQYESGSFSNWRIISNTIWQGITWPLNTPNGQTKSFRAGDVVSMSEYPMVDITSDGYAVLNDYLSGAWQVDPYSITGQ